MDDLFKELTWQIKELDAKPPGGRVCQMNALIKAMLWS
jgi:hypothetical protein